MRWAEALLRARAGKRRAVRTAMMAVTTSSSMRVKARFMVFPRARDKRLCRAAHWYLPKTDSPRCRRWFEKFLGRNFSNHRRQRGESVFGRYQCAARQSLLSRARGKTMKCAFTLIELLAGTVTNGGQLYWFGWLGPGAEGQRQFDATPGALYPYLQGRGVELCPSLNYSMAQFKLKAAGAAYGYGYNLYLSAALAEAPLSTAKITRPAETTLFADAAQINTFQPPASPSNPMLEEFYYVDNTPNPPNGHFRHSQKPNVASCDSHVALEKFLPGSLDLKMPSQFVARLRPEILTVP